MPYQTAEHFLRKYGLRKFLWLVEQLNQPTERRKTLDEIGKELKISGARVSQIMNVLFIIYVAPKPEVIECVEDWIGTKRVQLTEELEDFAKQRKNGDHLRIIIGGLLQKTDPST